MNKLLLITLLSSAGMVHAQEREWITYKKFVELIHSDRYYALPPAERDKLDYYLTLEPVNKNLKAADMHLTVAHAGMRTPLPLDDQAHLRMAPNQQWLAEGATIMTTQPKGEKISIEYKLGAVVPDGTEWPYNKLMGSVAQANAARGKIAGMLGYFVPNIKAVQLNFDQPAQLVIESKSGIRRFLSDAKNKIRLPADAALLQENPLVTVSARPLQADLETD